jgi:hypothetical protein
LGTTVDAIRGRLRRGTLDSVKLDGVVYVLLDVTSREQQSDQSETEPDDVHQQTADQAGLAGDQSALVGELRGQVDWLRRESERKDAIIMQMAQANASLAARVPELEAPGETRDTPEAASPRSNRGDGRDDAQEPAQHRSWWRRFFGLE